MVMPHTKKMFVAKISRVHPIIITVQGKLCVPGKNMDVSNRIGFSINQI
jgi:hypothetical protein